MLVREPQITIPASFGAQEWLCLILLSTNANHRAWCTGKQRPLGFPNHPLLVGNRHKTLLEDEDKKCCVFLSWVISELSLIWLWNSNISVPQFSSIISEWSWSPSINSSLPISKIPKFWILIILLESCQLL